MSIEQKIMQLQSDVVRLKKLVNYLMINGDKEINAEAAYLFFGFAFQATNENGENEWKYVGVALPASEIAFYDDTESESNNDLNFVFVDLMNKGIKKTDIPKTSIESSGVDWGRFFKINVDPTLINIYRPRVSYLYLVQEKYSLSKTQKGVALGESGEIIESVDVDPSQYFGGDDGFLKFLSAIRKGSPGAYYLEDAPKNIPISLPSIKPFINNFFDVYELSVAGEESVSTILEYQEKGYYVTSTRVSNITKLDLNIFFGNNIFNVYGHEYHWTSSLNRDYEPIDDRTPPKPSTNFVGTPIYPSPLDIFIKTYNKSSDDYLNFKIQT